MPVGESMADTNTYREYVLGQLEAVGKITARSMFGGVGIYHNGRFFAIIFNNVLYFKVDDTNRPEYENAGMKPFEPYPGRSGTMQYFEVPGEVIDDSTRLKEWAGKAIDVAKKSRKRAKARRKSK